MKARRLTQLAALFVVLAGCGGEESTGPQPGRLQLTISTPNSDDRAIALTITGTVTDIRAVAGYQLYVRTMEDRTAIIVVPEGSATFPDGETEVATLSVPDLRSAGDYSVAVIQGSGSDYELRFGAGYAAHLR
ncbi:MAG: hypothetical protein GTO46_07335 [Gemmatimonadetes bacterium]|nr:hypothetical protein [Gemmatimonadota bacterium]NIO31444.1 hypothetical protein [Gemmatimonadota bacterium]